MKPWGVCFSAVSFPLLRALLLAGTFLILGGCRAGYCEDGTCVCGQGSSCEFACEVPPCHVECDGQNAQCLGDCANGECHCGAGSTCDFTCDSEPCHVSCTDSSCIGECGNGDCVCERGSDCEFECTSGPCHVECLGDHDQCDGQCANGSCTCGENSSCSFECTDADCSFICESGSECIATCPGGDPGSQGCSFTQCAAGSAEVCPDGETLVCGAACPPEESEADAE